MSDMNNMKVEFTFRLSDGNTVSVDDIINEINMRRQEITEQLQRMSVSGFELSGATFSFEPEKSTMRDLKIPRDRIDNILRKDRERIEEIIEQLSNVPHSEVHWDASHNMLNELYERMKFYCRHIKVQMDHMTLYSGHEVDQFVRDWADHLVNRATISDKDHRALSKNLMGLGFMSTVLDDEIILRGNIEPLYNMFTNRIFTNGEAGFAHVDIKTDMSGNITMTSDLIWMIQYWCELIDQAVYRQELYLIKRMSEVPHLNWIWKVYDISNTSLGIPIPSIENLDALFKIIATLVNNNKNIDVVVEINRNNNLGIPTSIDLIRKDYMDEKEKFCKASMNVYDHYRACGAKFSGCDREIQKDIDFLLNYDLVGSNRYHSDTRTAEQKLKSLMVIPS